MEPSRRVTDIELAPVTLVEPELVPVTATESTPVTDDVTAITKPNLALLTRAESTLVAVVMTTGFSFPSASLVSMKPPRLSGA